MRAPFCNDCTDVCPHEKGLIASENENERELQLLETSLERNRGSKAAVFGICLDDLMGTSTQVAPQIPFILSRLCRYIEAHGLRHHHLFLDGDAEGVIEALRGEFILCGDAPLEETGDVASVAKLLILFFEELPEPLIPVAAQPDFVKSMERLSLNPETCLKDLKMSVSKLSDSVYEVLKYLSRFLLKVACHQKYNGMSLNDLAIIFGPVIFRSSKNPADNCQSKYIVNRFLRDYSAIFSDESVSSENVDSLPVCKQIPCPSSIMPVVSLSPLSVFIPSMDTSLADGNHNKDGIPILLIERQQDAALKQPRLSLDFSSESENKSPVATRKRKERRFSGEDSQQRSSSEERPKSKALLSLEKFELIRRCNSHEEIGDAATGKDEQGDDSQTLKTNASHRVDDYLSDTMELVNEKNHSPHPPLPKRREIEHLDLKLNSSPPRWALDPPCRRDSAQNPLADLHSHHKDPMELDEEEESVGYPRPSSLPRSASCPVPKAENEENSESESSSLSLSWSMLFEDSEPVRADNPWTHSKHDEDEALLSPSVHKLRNNFYEAPLSPSAFRSYLSHRSSHLDASVPPSPPVEQEDFAKKLVESNGVSDSIKQFTKKIHNIKRRIRKFDEKFEADYGYKPSHAEKSNHPEAKKLLTDLYKARKELKGLKEEAHLEHVSSGVSWRPSGTGHVLGDSTNQVLQDKGGPRPSVEDSMGASLRSLAEDRRNSNRPEDVEAMTTDQVRDEKMAIQRALLSFESVHGKPSSRTERNTIRPLYDRYRSVKRLLVRSGTYPGGSAKNKEGMGGELLQPILEHETMHFPTRASAKDSEKNTPSEEIEEEIEPPTEIEELVEPTVEQEEKKSNALFLSTKYDNSNFHELPLSEMLLQMQKVKAEKRHLRKILKEFESEFMRLNGRKVQKEDKAPVDTLYNEYKHMKARLKLLEALISKHDQHQLM